MDDTTTMPADLDELRSANTLVLGMTASNHCGCSIPISLMCPLCPLLRLGQGNQDGCRRRYARHTSKSQRDEADHPGDVMCMSPQLADDIEKGI